MCAAVSASCLTSGQKPAHRLLLKLASVKCTMLPRIMLPTTNAKC